ncbi:hypothetical protein [Bartonella sp. MR30HLJHH]|uniref:hypothetical protein n=1 Tax=Bartonella sp. MR30HLJHH TaxID=3243557 RepID=UPI0035D10981
MSDVTNDKKSYTDTKFEALRYDIKIVQKEVKQASSFSLVVSNLSYFDILWSWLYVRRWKDRSNISAMSSGGDWGRGAGLRLTLNL